MRKPPIWHCGLKHCFNWNGLRPGCWWHSFSGVVALSWGESIGEWCCLLSNNLYQSKHAILTFLLWFWEIANPRIASSRGFWVFGNVRAENPPSPSDIVLDPKFHSFNCLGNCSLFDAKFRGFRSLIPSQLLVRRFVHRPHHRCRLHHTPIVP